jgi:hypothetical protein
LTIENDTEYTYFIIAKTSENVLSDPSNIKTVSKTTVQINQTVPGTYSYSVPKGATCYDVTVIGGGGGGGSGSVVPKNIAITGCIGGSGGGGGGFSRSSDVSITSQTIFNYTVGHGGPKGNLTNGIQGGNSTFSDGLSLNVICNGGSVGLCRK